MIRVHVHIFFARRVLCLSNVRGIDSTASNEERHAPMSGWALGGGHKVRALMGDGHQLALQGSAAIECDYDGASRALDQLGCTRWVPPLECVFDCASHQTPQAKSRHER